MAFYRLAPTFADVEGLMAVVTATDGTTVTFDASKGNVHQVTLGGNRTLAVTGITPGRSIRIVLIQDGTGSRTVTWFSGIKWAGAAAPTLTTTAGRRDVITITCTAAGAYLGVASLNFN
jgi:plastocyanin